MTGWFIIDIIAIFPFNLILSTEGDDLNGMAKITRIGRMYKLVKLTRLLRILKMVKARSKLFTYIQDFLKITPGFERLFIFTMGFFMMCHIVSCLWVMTGQFDDMEDLDVVTW